VNFKKGCYPGQEIVARMQYLGRLKERTGRFRVAGPPPAAAARLYGDVFGDQPCGTVVNAARTPDGDSELLAVVQWAALGAPLRVGAIDGPALTREPLPYALPAPEAPNRPKLG
jgi:folate-binding Fe-S cluster repair protein YgfZ